MYATVKAEFITFLEQHSQSLFDLIVERGFSEVLIDFIVLSSHNRELENVICNGWKDQKMRNTLTETARDVLRKEFVRNKCLQTRFAVKHKIEQDDILEQFDRRISSTIFNISRKPNSVRNFKEFINQNKSVLRKLFQRHKKYKCEAAEMNPRGRRVLQKVIDEEQSAKTSKESAQNPGKSSLFPAQDRRAAPPLNVGPDAVDHLYPPYLLQLKSEFQFPEILTESDHFGWYYEYISFHPALIFCKARMNLIIAFYRLGVYLDYQHRIDYGEVFGDRTLFPDWTTAWYCPRAIVHDFLWKVFWYKIQPDETKPVDEWPENYSDTAGSLLVVLRHLLEHVFLHSKEWVTYLVDNKLDSSFEQTILSDDGAEIFASLHFPGFLPDFIKLIFVAGKMKGEFADYWNLYKAAKEC